MHKTRPLLNSNRNLLLCFDAFGTLFHPKEPIPIQYTRHAKKYGILTSNNTDVRVEDTFKKAYKEEAKKNPNYGKAVGMGAEKWWGNVITKTFTPFLTPEQTVPQALIHDLLTQFSTSEGYSLYPDILPFFRKLQEARHPPNSQYPQSPATQRSAAHWPWTSTTVGIITNSDSRVPGILSSFGLRVSPRRFESSHPEDLNPAERLKDRRASGTGTKQQAYDIDFIILSYDVGVSKPDPRIFSAAEGVGSSLSAPTTSPSPTSSSPPSTKFQKLYIGDSLSDDFFGAKNARWDALLLDRRPHADNLSSSPAITRYRLPGNAEKGERDEDVDVITSLEALRNWRPVNYLMPREEDE